MTGSKLSSALAAILLLTACEPRIGKDKADEQAPPAQDGRQSAAEGKAEQGIVSIDAPGFDLKIDIPEGIADRAETKGDIIYPGAKISGMHIAADAGADGKATSGVELRFASADPPDKVAGWYRHAARKSVFSVGSVAQDGPALVISGTQTGDGDPFTVRLSPAGAGTDGRVTLADRN